MPDSLSSSLHPPPAASSPGIAKAAADGGKAVDPNVRDFASVSTGNIYRRTKSVDNQVADASQKSSNSQSVPSFSKVLPLEADRQENIKMSPELTEGKSVLTLKEIERKSQSLEVSKRSTPCDSLSPQNSFNSNSDLQEVLPSAQRALLAPPERRTASSSQSRVEGEVGNELAPITSISPSSMSKPSSNISSAVNSGRTTPRSQSSLGTSSNVQIGKEGPSKCSPVRQASPPLTERRKPPQEFPKEYIKKKLESLVPADGVEPTLLSPLYSQEGDAKGINIAAGKEAGGILEEDDGNSKMSDVFDPHDSEDFKTSVVEAAVALSNPDALGSRISRRRERRTSPSKSSISKLIITKPGLDSNNFRQHFKKNIAEDNSEVLMNITWGIANLPSITCCELEVGAIITDRGIYLLEVLDPDMYPKKSLSWMTESLPLEAIMFCPHDTIRKVTIGIFDQSMILEACNKGTTKMFVLFPHTHQKLNFFLENMKAAFDATSLPFTIISKKDTFIGTPGKEEMVIVNPGSSDMTALKDNLLWSRCRAQVGNFVAVNSKSETVPLTISFESELKRVSSDLASKFEIVQYVIVGEVTSDILPVSNGALHVCSRVLILTNKIIYLCKEEMYSWPHDGKCIWPPSFPKCMVIDAHPISRITGIKMCDKSRPIISCSDPLYEFSISFEELDDIRLSPTLVREWILCVHDRQYLDQFLTCLTHLSNEQQKENQKHVSIKHVSSKLPTPASPKMPKTYELETDHRRFYTTIEAGSKKKSICSSRGGSPCFFSSVSLFEFSLFTNYQRHAFFKKHIAQAEFMKCDEVPLSVFLAHCSSCVNDHIEVEACVIVSNYALYLLSDVNNIQYWVESGGEFSYQRRDLLERTNLNLVRSFYRLWLSDIKQLSIGLYYTSVSITDMKAPDSPRVVIHTENPSATVAFLNAVSCVVDIHDTEVEKEMDHILSDYDLMDDNFGSETDMKKQSDHSAKDDRHKVEFVDRSCENLDVLKRAMVYVSPVITKGISFETCNATITILYQQVMLLVEELRIRDHLSSSFYPHFVFLTNYGVYVCLNKASEKCSPAVLDPSELSVKKWCHIDLLERLQVFSPSTKQYSCYNVVIHLRSVSRSSLSSGDSNTLSFLVQTSELLNCFLYHFSLMYHERCGKQISITKGQC